MITNKFKAIYPAVEIAQEAGGYPALERPITEIYFDCGRYETPAQTPLIACPSFFSQHNASLPSYQQPEPVNCTEISFKWDVEFTVFRHQTQRTFKGHDADFCSFDISGLKFMSFHWNKKQTKKADLFFASLLKLHRHQLKNKVSKLLFVITLDSEKKWIKEKFNWMHIFKSGVNQ